MTHTDTGATDIGPATQEENDRFDETVRLWETRLKNLVQITADFMRERNALGVMHAGFRIAQLAGAEGTYLSNAATFCTGQGDPLMALLQLVNTPTDEVLEMGREIARREIALGTLITDAPDDL